MTSSMETFYTCVGKSLVEELLSGDGEYLIRTHRLDSELKRLSSTLDKDVYSCLDDLLVEQIAIGELRKCAYFRAGFRLALELAL